MLKLGRSFILLIGPVSFALAMVYSVAMVYLTMGNLLIQCSVGEFLSAPILDAPELI